MAQLHSAAYIILAADFVLTVRFLFHKAAHGKQRKRHIRSSSSAYRTKIKDDTMQIMVHAQYGNQFVC